MAVADTLKPTQLPPSTSCTTWGSAMLLHTLFAFTGLIPDRDVRLAQQANFELNHTFVLDLVAVRWSPRCCLASALETLRWQLWHTPARVVRRARRLEVRILDGWPTADEVLGAYRRISLIT